MLISRQILTLTLLSVLLAACSQSDDAATTATTATPDDGAGAVLASGFDIATFDTSVRPQDDLFRYVNGAWLDSTTIPADKSNYGAFTELNDLSEQNVRELIEAAAGGDNAPGSDAQKVGDFYSSFMNEEAIEAAGIAPLEEGLARIDAIDSPEDVVRYIGESQRLGVPHPFAMFVNQDLKESTVYITYMTQTGLGLPNRDYYLEDEENFLTLRDKYRDYIATMYDLAGLENGQAAGETILGVETQIADTHWTVVENRQREKTYNRFDLEAANDLSKGFDWEVFLTAAELDPGHEFIIRQPSYFEALGAMVQSVPVDDWKTYFRFKLLNAAAPYMPAAFVEASFDFNNRAVQGVEEIQPRWKRGVQVTNQQLGELVGKVFVAEHFPPESKARMNELIENLRAAFDTSIDGLEWMGDETKAQAKEKLAKFDTKIGYPDRWQDYSMLEVDAGDLAGNMQRSGDRQYDRNLAKLGGPIDRSEWFLPPQTVNAYYNPAMNEIVFPAAILRPPFFNVEADDAVNYGAIGAVIGHEFSHGFDDQGRKSDGDGNLRDWWTEEDASEFKARAENLVAQYDGYSPLEGEYVNGAFTLGENIGDLAGLTMAYRAYQVSLDGKEAPIIGGYTGDQRFFIGWAQVWRRLYRDAEMQRRLKIDPHSPSEYRVNGIVVNMPEFYEAFEVGEGDGMYLAEDQRVKIW